MNSKLKVLFILASLMLCFSINGKASAGTGEKCGVNTGLHTSYAGLIIGYRAIDSTGHYRMPNVGGESTEVKEVSNDGSYTWGRSDDVGGNIFNRSTGGRVKLLDLTPQRGDSDNCVIGGNVYAATVLGDNYRTTAGNWQLDCDVSRGMYYQKFNVGMHTNEYPAGLVPWGYWSIDGDSDPDYYRILDGGGSLSNPFPDVRIMPPNGFNSRVNFTYHEPINWTLVGNSTVSQATQYAGSSFTYSNTIRNSGPNTAHGYNYSVQQQIINPAGKVVSTATIKSSNNNTLSPATTNIINSSVPYTIPSTMAAGSKICQILTYTDRVHIEKNRLAGGTYSVDGSDTSCVTVVSRPSIFTVDPYSSITMDQENPVAITYQLGGVKIAGNPTATTNTRTFTKNGTNITAPLVSNYTYNANGDKTTYSGNYSVPSGTANAGDKFCAKIVINPGSGTSPVTSESCKTVHNKPIFKAFNSGVSTGGSFKDVDSTCSSAGTLAGWNNSTSPTYRYGSGSQISSIALSQIYGFASAQFNPARTPTEITFTNVDSSFITSDIANPKLGGNYDGTNCLTNFDKSSTTVITSPVSSLTTSGAYSISGDLTISGLTIANNIHAAIYVAGNVYINGDIKYASYSTRSQIPSFVIKTKGNIYINSNVTNLDGVYVAHKNAGGTGGAIYTCSNGTLNVTSLNLYLDCNKQLVVNGAFIADYVNLLRTYGSMRDEKSAVSPATICSNTGLKNTNYIYPTCAAEVFILSPELYLWQDAGSITTGNSLQYDSITNLPPIL